MNRLRLKNGIITGLVLCVVVLFSICRATARDWQPDRFLAGFSMTTLLQDADYEGAVESTLVKCDKQCPDTSVGVLYIHGFNDYFFQGEMGEQFADSCYAFYALDLRKYGRSLLDFQKPCNVRNVSEYYPDIAKALSIMQQEGVEDVILIGHSTGGLIAASYMNLRDAGPVKALILNSPFLDWNMSGFMRKIAVPLVCCLGSHFPNITIKQGGGTAYGESLLKGEHGEWTFDTHLKSITSRNVTAGWINAINSAQKQLKDNAFIPCPILLMHSDKSLNPTRWTPECNSADIVLNVDDISRIGRTLGPDVTEMTVHGGIHDLILSAPAVREAVYSGIFSWLARLGF